MVFSAARRQVAAQVGLAVDPTLVRLADLAKAAAGLDSAAPAARPKVVIAQRRHTRVLSNATSLAAALVAAGMEASVQEFGSMTFAEQVRTASMHPDSSLNFHHKPNLNSKTKQEL